MCSCSSENRETMKQMEGRWLGSEWLVDGEVYDYDMQKINFEFKSDNRYTARLGDRNEQGTWRVKGNKLFTQDGAAAQIVVFIEKLTVDSLVLNMNRGGQREQMILKR